MKHGEGHQHKTDNTATRYTDPVCGMSTEDSEAFMAYEHEGRKRKAEFIKSPESFLGGKIAPSPAMALSSLSVVGNSALLKRLKL